MTNHYEEKIAAAWRDLENARAARFARLRDDLAAALDDRHDVITNTEADTLRAALDVVNVLRATW